MSFLGRNFARCGGVVGNGWQLLKAGPSFSHVPFAVVRDNVFVRCFATTNHCSARKFTKSHEWLELTDDSGVATLGISDHAQDALGDLVFCQLPDVGMELMRGGECVALESVKAASDVYSPVSGVVKEKNEKVEEEPALINKSPYEEGWLIKIELKDKSETDQLLDENAYLEFLKKLADEK